MKKGAHISRNSFFNFKQKVVLITVLTFALLTVFGSRFLSGQKAATTQPAAAIIEPTAQFCNANPMTIAGTFGRGPASPYPSTINVSGMTGVITGVSVTLKNIQHTWANDIDVLLVGPNGEKFVIMSDVGWAQGFDAAATVTISDAGAAQFGQGVILSGTYKPTNYRQGNVDDFDSFDAPAPIAPYNQPGPQSSGAATFDSVFRNANPNGAWNLYVIDDSSNNTGSIAGGWCLTIETGAPPPNQMRFAATNFSGTAGTTASVTVNRANNAAGAVSVNYATTNGTATGGASCGGATDFVSTNGTLNFADGETNKTFAVQLCPDTTLEANETINLTLSNPTGGAIIGIPATAVLTITPSGSNAVQFCNPNPINIPVTGSTTPYPATINVAGLNGTIRGVKVTLNNVQHSWASDLDVLLVSPSGRKFVVMSDVGEQNGFDSPATITLTDEAATDLLNVAAQIPSGAYKPTNLDAEDDIFNSPAPSAPYHQPFAAGLATFANVFNNTNPNGVWNLYVRDDSSGAGGSIGGWCVDISAGAGVADEIEFSAANYNRADETTANLTVLRPASSSGAVSVNYATANGTAIGGASCDEANVDYVSANGILSFADGETSKNVSVRLCRGDSIEPNETFSINLSNPTGGAVIGSPAAATVTIFNGDLPCNTFWTRAASPHQISGIRTILADEIVCIEPGATVSINGGGKINNYGEIRGSGTPTERITLTGSGRIVSAGTVSLDFADVSLQIDTSSTVTAKNTNFVAHGMITTFFSLFLTGTVEYVTLENVVFDSNEPVQSDNAQLYGSFYYLLMKNVTFRNRAFFNASSVMNKFENVRSENSAFEGFSFGNYTLQPQLLENLSVTNCARGGFEILGGNYFFGENISVQNCEYPVTGAGGILPGSVIPTTGNRNNWIEVGLPGGEITYAPLGIPYVVSGFANIGLIEFLPGVTVKARPNFAFNTGGGSPLDALGLPNAPITFERFDPSQRWIGGQFNSEGDRMEYVVLDGMDRGVVSPELSGADYYIDNSLLRNNFIGVKDMLNGTGSAFLQSNLFTNNNYAIVAENARIHAGERTNPNLFENNIVGVESISAPDVRNNWWNSPTGPTMPQNPGGTGDKINGGARFRPFLTARPDTNDHPPVVRLPRTPWQGAYEGVLEPGKKISLRWEAFDNNRIVKQKILFSGYGNVRKSFTKIADNLPPEQRSFEFIVPSVGFAVSGATQFIRVVAVDDKGQEGWEDWQVLIPSNEIFGELTITADVAGKTFHPGDEIPFTFQITSPFSGGGDFERYIIFDADRKFKSLGANSILTMPAVSTDTARLVVVYSRGLNSAKYFYSEPFAIRPDPRFPDAAPHISLLTPADGQQFNAGDAVPVAWSATDDEAIRYFNIQTSTDGGRTWIQTAENLPANTTSYNWQPEIRSPIADVRVRVVAVDRRFQNSSATRTVIFNSPANQAPGVQVTFPANGATYSVGQSTFIAASASDPNGTIQRVEFYAKGSASIAQTDPEFIGSDTTAPYQVPWNYPFAQSYVVTARAYDNKNRMITSAPVNVTVNPVQVAPLPIGIPELTNPVDGAVFPAPADITLEGLPAPTNRTIVRVEFYNGTTLVGTDTTAPYSMTLDDLPEGQYTFFVRAVADNGADLVSTVTDVMVGNAATTRRTRFDFDGDGKADVGIFRPSNGEWWTRRSGTSETIAYQFGSGTDKIVSGDFSGDGKTDSAIFRPASGEWFILRSEDSSFYSVPFGAAGDVPLSGDFDGDGRADPAVFRPSESVWYISKSTGGTAIQSFGIEGDVPVAADYDGDGKTDIAIFRPLAGEWWIQRSSDLSVYAFQFGTHEDLPVHADYSGDGKTDAAIFRPLTGEWFILRSEDGSFYSVPFGLGGDKPVPADYDGDGKADVSVFRNGMWYLQQSSAGTAIFQFGLGSDRPVPIDGASPYN